MVFWKLCFGCQFWKVWKLLWRHGRWAAQFARRNIGSRKFILILISHHEVWYDIQQSHLHKANDEFLKLLRERPVYINPPSPIFNFTIKKYRRIQLIIGRSLRRQIVLSQNPKCFLYSSWNLLIIIITSCYIIISKLYALFDWNY